MNAPLSLFLTRFSTPAPEPMVLEAAFDEPSILLTSSELEARIAAAATSARLEAERRAGEDLAARLAAQHAAAEARLEAARAAWTATESERLGAQIDGAMTALGKRLSERAAAALRPLLARAVYDKTLEQLTDAVDRLLADASRPLMTISGSPDLIETLRRTCASPSIEWKASDSVDVVIETDTARIETCLGAALATLEPSEA